MSNVEAHRQRFDSLRTGLGQARPRGHVAMRLEYCYALAILCSFGVSCGHRAALADVTFRGPPGQREDRRASAVTDASGLPSGRDGKEGMSGVWFRKCLRLHDNAALARAVEDGGEVVPFFILDPAFDRSRIGANRFGFLLDSLRDLDAQLREAHRSRLLVLRGSPDQVFREVFEGKGPFKLNAVYWERDTEPYARGRDARIEALASSFKVRVQTFVGHTLLDVDRIVASPGFKPPISMSGIQALVKAAGPIAKPLPVPKLPPLSIDGFAVPELAELYSDAARTAGGLFPGGEREALRRLKATCADEEYVCTFEKPKTASTGLPGKPWEPSTTGLSPYLKFGCLSVRTMWHAISSCIEGRRHSQPPQSLHGQLMFREMFYVLGAAVPNFDKAEGNSMCKPIPWGNDPALLSAWEEGRTGYPFIDALMRQLRTTGWMHHLGRHAVACFLTRGDLWQNWTAGRDVFDKYLLDADWAINNGNWLWLAGVAPFSAPYFRIYDPSPGGKSSLNAEQTGEFVKHFVPELKNMPAKYIYQPWKAPFPVQEKAGCIVGKDYPAPVVEHAAARDRNLNRFKAALEAARADIVPGGGAASASAPLPEKFGAGRKKDPGPMRTLYDYSQPTPGASTAKGRGKGRFAGKRPESEAVIDLTDSIGADSPQQRKQRRWGGAGTGGTSGGAVSERAMGA